jgi:hypothetical protein
MNLSTCEPDNASSFEPVNLNFVSFNLLLIVGDMLADSRRHALR